MSGYGYSEVDVGPNTLQTLVRPWWMRVLTPTKHLFIDDFTGPLAWSQKDPGSSGLSNRASFIRKMPAAIGFAGSNNILQFYAGDAPNGFCDCKRGTPADIGATLGLEWWWSYPFHMNNESGGGFAPTIEQFKGDGNEYRVVIQFNPSTGSIKYEDSAGAYQTLTPPTGGNRYFPVGPTSRAGGGGSWNYTRIEGDFSGANAKYKTLIHNDYDYSSQILNINGLTQAKTDPASQNAEFHFFPGGSPVKGLEVWIAAVHFYVV